MKTALTERNLKKFYSDNILDELNSNKSLTPYYVTVNFRSWYPVEDRGQILSHKGIGQLRQYHNIFYRYIHSNMMNNFTRKHSLHSKVYSFVDFEGTRENPDRIIINPVHPHTHDIWLVHDKTRSAFEVMLMEGFPNAVKDRANPDLISVHAGLIKIPTADMEQLVSYAAKFVTNHQGMRLQARGVPLIDQLPPSKSERKVRRDQPDVTRRKERFHDDPIGNLRRESQRTMREFRLQAGRMKVGEHGASANTQSQLFG